MKKNLLVVCSLILFIFLSFSSYEIHALPSPWAEGSIFRLELIKILEGEQADSDKFQNKINREEFCELLIKFYLYVEDISIERFGSISPFNDTESKYVIAAYKLGIVKGKGEGEFKPSSIISREEVATMLYRAMENMLPEHEAADEALFSDDKKISAWAKDGVYFCKNNELIKGYGANTFAPGEYSTREQLIVMLDRALIKLGRAPLGLMDNKIIFGEFNIPAESKAGLSYSSNIESNIILRIAREGVEGAKVFDVMTAAGEIYEVLKSNLGAEAAEMTAFTLRDEWSYSHQSFSRHKKIGISENGKLRYLKADELERIVLRFNGDFIIDIYKKK